MDYPSRIKIHNPCREGILVELHGEFDVACLEALRHALTRASQLGSPAFLDLSGVDFMDALCTRELVSRAGGDEPLKLCRPSEQFELSLSACGTTRSVEFCPEEDPGCRAVISQAHGRRTPWRPAQRREHRLHVRWGL